MADNGALVGTEEKEPVLHKRSAQRPAELVAYQPIILPRAIRLFQGKRIGGVEPVVSEKLEHISSKAVGARLRHGVDRGARVHSVFGGQAAGGHPEFLQRIRKGERQVQVVLRIVVHGSVEKERHAEGLPAGDRVGDPASHAPGVRFARPDGCSGNGDEIGRVAPVERQRQDFLGPDHLAHARALHVHERRGPFNGDRLLDRAERQDYVDRRSAGDLKHDARLGVGAKPRERYFQSVGTGRQVG